MLGNRRTRSLPVHIGYPSRALLPRRITAAVEATTTGLRDMEVHDEVHDSRHTDPRATPTGFADAASRPAGRR